MFAIEKAFADAYEEFFEGLLTDCDFPEEIADSVLFYTDPIYGTEDPEFKQFMAPGMVILIIFFLALSLTGEIFVTEKTNGLLDRYLNILNII